LNVFHITTLPKHSYQIWSWHGHSNLRRFWYFLHIYSIDWRALISTSLQQVAAARECPKSVVRSPCWQHRPIKLRAKNVLHL